MVMIMVKFMIIYGYEKTNIKTKKTCDWLVVAANPYEKYELGFGMMKFPTVSGKS